jgi:hypothetical protein
MAQENEDLLKEMDELRRSMQGLGTASNNADASLTKFAKDARSIGTEIGNAAEQFAAGGGEFKSLNGVVSLTSKAMGSLLGLIPGVGGAFKELSAAAGDVAKSILSKFDDLAKINQAYGESSSLAADGIDGIQRQFKQMGLISLPTFTKAVNDNAASMVSFGGDVATGAEKFSKLTGALTEKEVVEPFLKLGLSVDQVGEQASKYVATYSRLGLTQGKTFDELKASTQNYIYEVDQIARITGMSRKQQEDEQQKAMLDVRARAVLADLRDKGQTDQANQLNLLMRSQTGVIGESIRATASGIPTTEQAGKVNSILNNAIVDNVNAVKAGTKNAAEANLAIQRAARDASATYQPLFQFSDIADGAGAQIYDLGEQAKAVDAEMIKRGQTEKEYIEQTQKDLIANNGATKDFASAQANAAKASKNLQETAFSALNASTGVVNKFSGALEKATNILNNIVGSGRKDAIKPAPGTAPSEAEGKKVVGSEEARSKAEAYLGKKMSDSEFSALIKATHAEAGAGKGASQQEQAMIMASILNRARTDSGGIMGALYAKNQFQSVTGTAADGNRPSKNFLEGPGKDRLASIEGATAMLDRVAKTQKDFTAASAAAYGAGTNIGYRDKMLATGGQVIGGSVFRTSMMPESAVSGPSQTYQSTVAKVNPNTTLTQSNPAEATDRKSTQDRSNEQMMSIFSSLGDKLDAIARNTRVSADAGDKLVRRTG